MKKIWKLFISLTVVLVVSFFGVFTTSVSADIGFDGDYDSGGSDWGGGYGSDWDDDYDYDYSYDSDYSGEPLTIGQLFIVLGISAGLFIFIMYISKLSNNAEKSRATSNWIKNQSGYVDHELNREVFDLYVRINDAWMNKNLEPVRELLTDEMYNMYLMQMTTLEMNGQTNVMSNYSFVSGKVIQHSKYRGMETVILLFRVRCKDYIVDSTGRVVRGSKHKTCDYLYEIKLIRNSAAKKIKCPSCGANLDNKDGVKCSHCGSVIHAQTDRYRLANKEMVSQRRY